VALLAAPDGLGRNTALRTCPGSPCSSRSHSKRSSAAASCTVALFNAAACPSFAAHRKKRRGAMQSSATSQPTGFLVRGGAGPTRPAHCQSASLPMLQIALLFILHQSFLVVNHATSIFGPDKDQACRGAHALSSPRERSALFAGLLRSTEHVGFQELPAARATRFEKPAHRLLRRERTIICPSPFLSPSGPMVRPKSGRCGAWRTRSRLA
jgi:hypothetical protein